MVDSLDPRALRLGVSRCLLGERVRYDGNDRHDPWVVGHRSRADDGRPLHWVGVCPEVEMGMDVPREPVQLEGAPAMPRMKGVDSRVDHTPRFQQWAAGKLSELGVEDLDGYVLKSRSPSCGLGDTDLFDHRGKKIIGRVDGLFAAALRRTFPFLPLTTEQSLEQAGRRELFLQRARLYRQYKEMVAMGAEPSLLRTLHEEVHRALETFGPPEEEPGKKGGERNREAEEREKTGQERLEEAYQALLQRLEQGGRTTKELTEYGQLLHDLFESLDRG